MFPYNTSIVLKANFTFSDNDVKISHEDQKEVERTFTKDLDIDGDRYLSIKELTKWVEPDGFEEVKYIHALFYL